MPRTASEQRRYLSRDCYVSMKALFGTIPNAYNRLGFTDARLTFSQFREATNMRPVDEQVAQTVEDRWAEYQEALRQGEVHAVQGWTLGDAA